MQELRMKWAKESFSENAMSPWTVDQTRILSRTEIALVLADLHRRARRSRNSKQNLTVFRLATCCGLRASEIANLKVGNVHVGIDRPYLDLPKRITKGRKPRRVALWWDASTLADVTDWKGVRVEQGANPGDRFVCAQAGPSLGYGLARQNIRSRFLVACRVLGPERVATLTAHDGRHSFVSHALAGGRSLAEVQQAAGHASLATTSVYLHLAVDDDGTVGNLFDFTKNGRDVPA